jgi:RHS repeat-associated protein
MPRFKKLLAAIALTALPLAAQTTPPPAQVSFSDDFQSYGEHKNPPGWVDTSVGSSKPVAGGLFKTWPDPTQGNKATNVVYGTQQSSGNPSGNNPRIGTFSTWTTTSFPAKGGFEYRGRFIRTNATTQSGLTFFSSYPEKDQYYLVGAWPQANGTLTMQLFAFGGGAFTGIVDSGFTPAINTWYRFFIQSDDAAGATNVRVRFWADGAAEPSTFSIDAKDATPAHLTAGRIGIWSAVKGDTFVDDLSAKSSIDRTPPAITFREHDTQRLLDAATLALFKTPAKIDVSIVDDLSAIATRSIKLDGADYVSGTPIATDRAHTIVVDATDAAGNAAHATLNLLVDQLPPVVALSINDAPFTDGQIFSGDVTVKASITDSSDVRTVATLDGTVVALPAPTAEERRHDFKVIATDQVLWSTEVTRSFFVDKSAPVVTILANGRPLGDADTFAQDVTLTYSATDLTLDTVTARLDGVAIPSGFVVTVSRVHELVVTANDKAGHSTIVTRSFPLSKTQPEVHLFANGAPFVAGTSFRAPVAFTATMTDPTPTSYVATVDNHDYHLGDTIAGEDHHTITLRVTNAAHLEAIVGPHPFTIDLHPPAVTLSEGGAPFEAGKKFTRDVVPIVAATDNFTTAPRRTLLVDGHDYPLDQPIASESADHTIEAIAVDDAGNSASVGPFHFVLDKTKPLVTVTDGDKQPFAADALFAHAVQLRVTVIDVTSAPPVAAGVTFDAGTRQTDGSVVYLSQPISADDTYDIAIVATDVVGLANDAVHARFRIDTKPPVITFTAPAENASLGAPSITVAGTSDDAETVSINGRDALVDTTAHTFTIDGVALLEGKNQLVAIAFDKAGNRGTASRAVTLDTAAPQLTVISPLRDACVRTNELTVSGRASDANLASVNVSIGGTPVTATTAADGSWSATLPLATEGRVVITVEAIDVSGHSTTVTIPISVDRTVPRIEVSEGGKGFSGGAFNRTLAPTVRVIDEDPNVVTTIALDGRAYASGAGITPAGAHTLVVNATDCAGNIAAATSIAFTIDLTPPVITSFDPADGSTIGDAQATIRGHVDETDLASVAFEGTPLAATLDGANFTFTNVPLTEGTNRFAVVATDRAGNRATRTYTLQVKTTAPSVEILDDGAPLGSGRTFARSVRPIIRANDPAAAISATLNGAAFTSGTTIATDGSYSLNATATDSVGHTGTATATFTIDRTAPVVTITSPVNDASVTMSSVEVRGTFTGSDVAAITVNGIDAIRSANTFVATVALEEGTNVITATASDNAGNIGEARIEVTRAGNRPGIVLTAPIDKTLTNRSTTAVIGQLLSFVAGTKVTINGSEVAVDPIGVFRRNDFALIEGDNAITAAVAGSTKSVTIHLTADFTPPALTIRANGADLTNGARFATAPALAVTATDANPNVTTRVTLDGVAGSDTTSLGDGGHLLASTARDAAGNETRIDRTFFIGAAGAGSACSLSLTALDPANFSTILGDHVLLSGRSGGAANVLVNGARPQLADGTFSASVQLVEGRNDIAIRCADAAGNASGDAITLTLFRLSGSPSVRIITPANESIAASDKITVTGEVGEGVIAGDVNGIPFTVPNDGAATHPFTVANVSVVNGLNVIAARARDGAGRTGVATIHVVRYSAAPRLEITSPIAGTQHGGSSIDVSGTYANVDPSTFAIGSAIVTTQPRSDTSGTFTAASVPLTGATTTITVTARSRANVATTASVEVLASGGPSITIDAPRDNVAYASTATVPDAITGTINAAGGATVVVNGVEATVTDSHFSAAIAFAANGNTNVVARVAQPDGKSAVDAIRLTKLAPLTIVDSFPAQNATAVDRGALLVILFSNPLDAATVGGALRLVDSGGNVITGATFVDSDAVSFAPAVPFASGGHYTLTISTAAKDIAGQSLASPFVLTFDSGSLAPAVAPTVDATDDSGCFTTKTIHGSASVGGARIRADVDGVPVATTAAADRSFTLDLSFSGQSGYHTVRVRELGADGALSPERTISYRINCAGPQVTAAALDRAAKTLTITFSKAMKPASLIASASGTIVLGTLTGTVALDATAQIATVTYTANLTTALTLVVTKDMQDATGVSLGTDFTQTFPIDDATSSTGGFISGAVYDATNGRPLTTARIDITPSAQSINVDERGRYSRSLGEGAYTLRASAPGFATVWRQLVVPAGAGVVPIDIRLTKRGSETAAPFALVDAAQTSVTRNVELTAPSSSLTPGAKITLTAVGGQSLAGLLPLGWSPLAAAEVAIDGSSVPVSLAAAKLTFVLTQADADALTAASQTLSLVTYDVERDEWRVVAAVVPIAADRRVTTDIIASGNYALVYPDKAPSLAHPPTPHAGAALQGVANPCSASADACAMRQTSFPINPTAVLPNQRATATLVTDNNKPYPSGTAVQAYIDEELHLADGRVVVDPPFATDLLIYRNPAGDAGSATFHIAPSSQAATVTLRDGVDHIRVVDYPGRIDRGTLVGAEGGRIPGDEFLSIDVPAGATTEAIHASSRALTTTELSAIPSIAGFHVAGGFELSLTRATDPSTAEFTAAPLRFIKSARATFVLSSAQLTGSGQVIVVELLPSTPYGALARLAARTNASTSPDVAGTKRFATIDEDPALFPVDGIVAGGRYLVLVADAPIAFTWGRVQRGASGPSLADTRVSAAPLGVGDLSRIGGLFALPVPTTAFTLVPRHFTTGDGVPAAGPRVPQRDEIVPFGVLVLAAQAPNLTSVTPSNRELDPSSPLQVQATFDSPIDPTSATGGILVNNLTTGSAMAGTSQTVGNVVTFTPAAGESLVPASRYAIAIASTIRGTNGAPFGRVASYEFTTAAVPPPSKGFNPAAIRVTIPDAGGVSTITGTSGAIPANAIALAVRSGQSFIQQYQTVASTAGTFQFTAGGGAPYDRLTLDDDLSLHVIDSISHSTIAIIPLTPFVTPEGDGFVATPGTTSTFTTDAPLSVTITVPAGAFEKKTLVRVQPAAKTTFSAVPSLDAEVNFIAGINVVFDGIASVPLELDIPVPAGTVTDNRTFLLLRLGDSSRGPRLEIDDLLRVENGKFTTRAATTNALRAVTGKESNAGVDLRSSMLRVVNPASYAATDIRVPSGNSLLLGAIEGLEKNLEIFFEKFNSLYASNFYLTANRGRIIVPAISGQPFTVEGVEAASGISIFTKSYTGIDPAPPGQATLLGSPVTNVAGPYPLAGDPFRIEVVDVPYLETMSVPGFTITMPKTTTPGATVSASVAPPSGTTATTPQYKIFNITTAKVSDFTHRIDVRVGDRLLIVASNDSAEPTDRISLVFNEAIKIASDAALPTLFRLEQNYGPDKSGVDVWRNVSALATYRFDSGRRITLTFPSELQRGVPYRLVVESTLTDEGTPPLNIGKQTGGEPLYLPFMIRKPKGSILPVDEPFTLRNGVVRDLALDGNLLLVSALDGGISAYDISDPAALSAKPPNAAIPIARARATPEGGLSPGESWGVVIDHHGRVFATALNELFGLIRSYRVDQFTAGASSLSKPLLIDDPYAVSIISWRPGINVSGTLNTTLSTDSDRQEATPRKLQLSEQDDSRQYVGGTDFDEKLVGAPLVFASATSTGRYGDAKAYTVQVRTTPNHPYRRQRISIINETLGVRWSQDARTGTETTGPASFTDVLVRVGDKVRISRNESAYGIVSMFGYGVGVFDLNAIESNSAPNAPAEYRKLGEQIAVTTGQLQKGCDEASQPAGTPCDVADLTFSAEAALTISSGVGGPTFHMFGLDPRKGIAEVSVTPNASNSESTGNANLYPTPLADAPIAVNVVRVPGLPFTGSYVGGDCSAGPCYHDHPRLATLRRTFRDAHHTFAPRFGAISRYDAPHACPAPEQTGCTTSYALVAGGQAGILVVDLTPPLTRNSFADVIWVPAGVNSVRVITGTHYATAVDARGRALLIDLSHLDERAKLEPLTTCKNAECSAPLFETVTRALAGGDDRLDPNAFGNDDPRIVWKSDIPVGPAFGTLAPVADPETGFLFNGEVLQQKIGVMAATDPRISVKVNLGGLNEVGAVVPLGLPLPADQQTKIDKLPPCGDEGPDTLSATPCKENASPGVFRVEIALPGSLPDTPRLAVESERLPGVIAPQTATVLPLAHLRNDGPETRKAANFSLSRVLPAGVDVPNAHFQKAWNRFTTAWIVALADPRASADYLWDLNKDRDDAGCFRCKLPRFLDQRSKVANKDFFEILTTGRNLVIRPDVVFTGDYQYLGQQHRIFARVGTVMADTVRPADVLIAPQAAPVASGAIDGTIYLHSGELATSNVDLDAGGRAGWNVVVDRNYLSRTLSGTALGLGWDSGMFKRLRTLPNRDVEYRDGSGEVWLFKFNASDASYAAPKGYFTKLIRTDGGWSIVDQKRRVSYFDDFGRVVREGDEFYTPAGDGNQIRYLYDDHDRLTAMVDPNERKTSITYTADGLVNTITDWQQRTITFTHTASKLTRVQLPTFGAGTQPIFEYGYATTSGDYNDQLELATNLTTIKDPNAYRFFNSPRTTYTYGGSAPRDYVATERWGTGSQETATFTYTTGPEATAKTVDVLGQERNYTFKKTALTGPKSDAYTADRQHLATTVEKDVEFFKDAAFGALPSELKTTTTPARTDRTFTYDYTTDGLLKRVKLSGGTGGAIRSTGYAYEVSGSAPGQVTKCSATVPGDVEDPCAAAPAEGAVRTTFTHAEGYLTAMAANGASVNTVEPHRGQESWVSSNDSVSETTAYDLRTGLPTSMTTTGGTDTEAAGSSTTIHYPTTQPSDELSRGLPTSITAGSSNGMTSTFSYGLTTDIVSDARTTTVTSYDTWRRPTQIHTTSNTGDELTLDETFAYDPSGQVNRHTRKQGSVDVATDYTYDIMGRLTFVRTNNVAVGANANSSVDETTSYDGFASGTIRKTSSSGSITDINLDRLGRTTSTTTDTGFTKIESQSAYDIAGNPVFASDKDKAASARAYDVSGRVVSALGPDLSSEQTTYDGWGRPTLVSKKTASGTTYFSRTMAYTPAGKLQSVQESGDGNVSRGMTQLWDGGGRATRIATTGNGTTGMRIRHARFDDAGRLQMEESGEGADPQTVQPFEVKNYQGYGTSDVATTVQSHEPRATQTPITIQRSQLDTLGRPKSVAVGDLEWKQTLDQAGNVTRAAAPGRPETSMQHDARGLVTSETLADGSVQSHEYHASGAATAFSDPTSEQTQTDVDAIGRPRRITYPDGSTELINYLASRVSATKDRQERWQSFEYNTKGQLTAIYAAQAPGGQKLDAITYDDAGRVTTWKTRDALISISAYTGEGKPLTTVQTRYRDHSGLTLNEVILDSYTVAHQYNGYGEITQLTMPGNTPAPWTQTINYTYDAAGNLASIQRNDATVLTAAYRSAGRPMTRSIVIAPANCATPPCAARTLLRSYGYDTSTSQMTRMAASINDTIIAGSAVQYAGSLQISDVNLLGISNDTRHTRYTYDARSRVFGSVTGVSDGTVAPPAGAGGTPSGSSGRGVAQDLLTRADFRHAQQRTSQLDPAVRQVITAKGIDADRIDPSGMTATESAAGHKVVAVKRGAAPQTALAYKKADGSDNGAVRTDDGLFHYDYDEKQRLIAVTEKPTSSNVAIRRVEYGYDGNNRLIGRTARSANVTSLGTALNDLPWQLEQRPNIIAADGLPAETTFVWDMATDRLIAAFGGDGTPLKQIIHGDMAYDDPIEVTTIDPTIPVLAGQSPHVTRLYPIYDEAGTGSLQAVVNINGDVVARSINTDPYGGEEFDITGAAVDRVSLSASKNQSGNLESVTISIRSTEILASATVAAGTRLAALDGEAKVLRRSDVAAAVSTADPYTAEWTLTGAQWTTLTTGAASVSIAVTDQLRAAAWSIEVPVLQAPEWATASKPVFATAALPVEVRESTAHLTEFIAAIPPPTTQTTTPYDIPGLASLGTAGSTAETALTLAATFQAQPFADPMTRKFYVRERWYDPGTGGWLTPDPLSYRDSANLYAFAGGDPVNGRDPTGEGDEDPSMWELASEWFKGAVKQVSDLGAPIVQALPLKAIADGGKDAWAQYAEDSKRAVVRHYDREAAKTGGPVHQLDPQAAAAVEAVTDLPNQSPREQARTIGRWSTNAFVTLAPLAEGVFAEATATEDTTVVVSPTVRPKVRSAGAESLSETLSESRTPATVRRAGATRQGVTRTNAADWRRVRDLWDEMGYEDILSKTNREFIAKGRTPVVDDEWVKHFPGDDVLMREKIPLHHIDGGKISVPLPESRHIDAHKPGGFRRNPGGPGTSG